MMTTSGSRLGAHWERGGVTGQLNGEHWQDMTQALTLTVKETAALMLAGEQTDLLFT